MMIRVLPIIRWVALLLQVCTVYASVQSYVDINLDDGVVNGYSERVHFISTPTADDNGKCGKQAVIKINIGGQVQVVHFHLKYNVPRLWTFHLSDSLSAEGYGYYATEGNNSTIEMQVLNEQMRVYTAWPMPTTGSSNEGNEPGSTHSQWMFLRVVDETIQRSNAVELSFSVKGNTFRWHDDRLAHDFSAPPGLFYDNGIIKDNITLYVGMNRIVSGNWRTGSGLCHLSIKLMEHEQECNAEEVGCDVHAICKPNRRGYHCSCKRGWQGNGTVCQDINECLPRNAGCVHKCHNTMGSYRCSCHSGFTTDPNDPHNCIDIDECTINNGGCEQKCINTIGSYECQCVRNGVTFTTNQKHCRGDINECAAGEDGCQHKCVNMIGSYECLCPPGFKLNPVDERSCIDIDECEVNDTCEHTCINTPGSYSCECTPGYELFGKTHCGDIDECADSNGGCPHICVNTQGSYYCSSRPVDHKRVKLENECVAAYSANLRFLVSGIPEPQKKTYGQSLAKKLQEQISDCHLHFNKMQIMPPRKVSNTFGHVEGHVFQVHMEITCKSLNKTIACNEDCHSTNAKETICRTSSELKERSNKELSVMIENRIINIIPKSLAFRHFHLKNCGGKGERIRVQDLCSQSQQWKDENGKKLQKPTQLNVEVQNIMICHLCPKDTYQNAGKQKSCKRCPENSFTDGIGSLKLDDCKRTKCESYMSELSGFIESPNFPGDYPSNADCSWILKPPKRRRLLIIVSELHLAGEKCQDSLMMRKSKSPYSPVTFEACRSITKPVAFVAQSKTLWINFRSDSTNNSRGFHISFVTYNEEYQTLIEDIVQDSRLYASQNHLEILRDKKLLAALMEVIAQPINYYKYESEKRKMFPSSFIRFMTPKNMTSMQQK
ncbi:Vitellogenin receptor [Gryllus bimaculatus]|nr:Vitellogenin receptor [Gryllus bimaculatus]